MRTTLQQIRQNQSSPEETRKARNRITAKRSREKRMAYIEHLERSLREANQRVADLERRMLEMQREHDEEMRLEREFARVFGPQGASRGSFLFDEEEEPGQ